MLGYSYFTIEMNLVGWKRLEDCTYMYHYINKFDICKKNLSVNKKIIKK